jgi:hypothetical protein
MSDKSRALRAKSDDADHLKIVSPAGHGQHGDGTAQPGVTGH